MANLWDQQPPASRFPPDPAGETIPITAFEHLSLPSLASPSPYLPQTRDSPETTADDAQSESPRLSKRIKVCPQTPSMESIDAWVAFDDSVNDIEPTYDPADWIKCEPVPDFADDLTLPRGQEDAFSSLNMDRLPVDQRLSWDFTPETSQFPASMPWDEPSVAEGAQRRPQRGMKRDASQANTQPLSTSERLRLIGIAMGTTTEADYNPLPNEYDFGPRQSSPSKSDAAHQERSVSPRSMPSGSVARSPVTSSKHELEPKDTQTRTRANRRCKSTRQSTSAKSPPLPSHRARSASRTAHCDVERKYRENLKGKIAELQDAIPSLQCLSDDESENGSAASPGALKVSKGTVLSKATEYIHQLEQRNRVVVQQHERLTQRLQAFETILINAARQQSSQPPCSRDQMFESLKFC